MLKTFSFLLLISASFCALSQEKKKINHKDYDQWNSIPENQISTYGNIVTYVINPYRGDGDLNIYRTKEKTNTSITRGASSKIAFDESFVVFKIKPQYDSIRKLKIDKVPKKKWPKDSLGILVSNNDIAEKDILKYPEIASYKIGKKGGEWVAMLHDKKYKLPQEEKKRRCIFRKKKKEKEPKKKGEVLRLIHPSSKGEHIFESVKEYQFSNNGAICSWIQSKTFHDSIDSSFISVFDAESQKVNVIWKGQGEASKIALDEAGNQIAFLWSTDTSKIKVHSLCYWTPDNGTKIIVDTVAPIFNSKYSVSSSKTPYFSKNGKRLFFGVADKPLKKPKDTIPEDEKPKMDVWSWTDGRIQPQQLKELKKDKKRADLFMYLTEQNKFQQILDSTLQRIKIPFENNGDYGLATTQLPYLKEMTWDTWYYDYYRVDLNSGDRIKLIEHHGELVNLSPSGKYFAYYSSQDSAWYVKDLVSNSVKNLTKDTQGKFYKKNHDVPGLPGAAAQVKWLVNEQNILIKDQNDYWVCSLSGGKPYKLTNGAKENIHFGYVKFDPNEEYVNLLNPLYFKTFNEVTKDEGIAKYDHNGINTLFQEPSKILSLTKADSSDKVILRQMSVSQYPEIQVTDLNFDKSRSITNANPQQKEYNWATVELVHWKTYEGDSIAGLLYKPENFDSTKQYPLMVYFYERYTDDMHNYYSPKPTASIIYPTEYASNGYLVFIPDISYEEGHPAKSAFNYIVSGTEALLKKHSYIDSTRMALQGQSWGGYQTAQLITMTNKYKCAMAGAPVSNMISAYGGIRWGSGLNRAFQYEKGQSRIGKTIWEAPELYIENSPVFHLPNVQTPLLIMHNDGDGAVPWYQGIELFAGLRRLNKPVWMFNYNGDEHNLMKPANRMDLSIRMRQFFDHYLLNDPMPEWMEKGLPALKNEKNK